jgi:hypothetical protein
MADRKISDLTALTTPASGDYLPIVDISETAAASKNKRITIEELMRGAPDGTAAAPSIAFESDPNTGIYSPGADQLALATAGNGRLFIDGTGFVGIGTTPTIGYALDVRGLTRVLTVGGASGLEIGTGTATNQFATLDLVGDATYTDYGLRILRGNSGANADSNIAHKGTGALSLITEEAAPIVLATAFTERARIDSSGNVGIGTSSPGYALDVAAADATANTGYAARIRANAIAGAGALQFTDSAATAQYGLLVFGANGVGTLQADGASSRLVFSTNSTERLRIDSSGRVGIGTSSPTTLLDVNADTVRVRTARTPASASATGDAGEICWDANYVYVCTATNTWKRAALSTW